MIRIAKESIFLSYFQLCVSHAAKDYRVLSYRCVEGWQQGKLYLFLTVFGQSFEEALTFASGGFRVDSEGVGGWL